MACALVLPYKRLVLYVSELFCVATLHLNHVCQCVKALLSGLLFVDDDGIV